MNEEEKLEFEDQEEEQSIEILPKERRVYSDKPDRSIFELYRQYQKGNLELQPEFQRLQVWDNSKSSRLIESVLLEVPIPVIYLSEESDGKYSVIDGQQRLNAFIKFLENNLKLSGLTILTELNGKRFQDIPKNFQDKFESATIRIIEIRKESDPDVKFEIFERLNTGAVQLNAQELRNCVYRGKYNELIRELAEDKDFQFLLGLEGPHYRMQDRELILRFFALFHTRFDKWLSALKEIVGAPKTEPRTFSLDYKEQLWKSNPTCDICGQRIHLFDDAEVDHVEQYWRGGKTIPANARLVHRYCNRARPLNLNGVKKISGIQGSTIYKKKYSKISKGLRTPNEAFRLPILKALDELGGKGKINEVLEKVENYMKPFLKPIDYEKLKADIRWRNAACWERLKMVKENLLNPNSPKGLWEITEKGKKYLKNSKGQEATNGV